MPDPVFFGRRAAPETRPVLLLIDDEPLVGRFIAHAAEECGFESLTTTSVDRFRSAYRARTPDFVAVDLGVPGQDGIEILRFLAAEKCTAPVIIISGFDRRVLESSVRFGEALGLNMAGSLEKPVTVHELATMLCAPSVRSLQ
jgi:DNA-binding response OmpR family regulator